MKKPSNEIVVLLAKNVKRLREERGYSQEILAEKCNLHRTYVGAIERAERNVTLSTLEMLAKGLGTDVLDLLGK